MLTVQYRSLMLTVQFLWCCDLRHACWSTLFSSFPFESLRFPARRCDISGTLVVPLVVLCRNIFFLCKILRARSYLKIIGVAWGVAQGARAPSIEMPPMTKIWQNSLVYSLSVSFSIFACNSTCVQQHLTINSIDDQGAWRTPLIQFFPTNLNVYPGWNQAF